MSKRIDAERVALSKILFFERLYKLIACVGMISAVAPLLHALIYNTAGILAVPIAVLGTAALFAAGYCIQMFFGAVIGIRRDEITRSYEKTYKYFHANEAALPLALCGAGGIGVMLAVADYMRMRYESGIDRLYDKWSLIPIIAGIAVAGIAAAGVISWFFPYNRLLSLRSMLTYTVMLVAACAMDFVFGVPQGFLIVCCAIFLAATAVVMNQGHIVTVINATGTGIVTPKVRMYNLIAVGMAALFVCIMMPAVITAVIGIVVSARMLLFFILRGIFGNTEEMLYTDASEQAANFSSNVFGEIADIDSEALTKGYFAVFWLIIFAVVLFVIFIRKHNVFRSIYDFINNLFANIMDFFSNLFEFNKLTTEMFQLSDYKDVETKTDKNAIREYNNAAARPKSYRDFIRKLDSIPDTGEKIKFAYAELISHWGTNNIRLNLSDTPSEIKEKIITVAQNTDAEPITDAFETVKYAERSLSPSEANNVLGAICRQIKRGYSE